MSRVIELIGGTKIGPGQPCFIVAEIGQNHNGDVYTATRLMKAAADAGVDAVKLCKRHLPSELTAAAARAPYEGPNSFGKTYGEHRAALELTPDEYRHLKDRARYNQWPFVLFATACDCKSVDDVEAALDPPLYKIAGRDLDNLPLLDYVARLQKPVLLSTGMAEPGEIRAALDTIHQHHDRVVLMVCTSQYPTPNNQVRLRRLWDYRRRFGCLVGMSDHTAGITAGTAAAALGACVVEKHVTLSRALKGTDHAASLEPEGLRRLVMKIREVEEMLSTNGPPPDCSAVRAKLGRSLATARPIAAGVMIEESDLCLKSPGTGLRWADRGMIVGKAARRSLPADVTIDFTDVLEPNLVS